MMQNYALLFGGALFVAGSIITFVFKPKQALILLNRLGLRVNSGAAGTPPRSLSPGRGKKEKALKESASHCKTLNPDYSDILPPSCRDAFHDLYEELPTDLKNLYKDADNLVKGHYGTDPEKKPFYIPHDKPYQEWSDDLVLPTGITVREARLLGDFPNYAALSGVPLPEEYKNFDIDKALPRPYRPFRWAYHQTMSLMKLDTDFWLELEKSYKSRIAQRKSLNANNPKLVLQTLPGSELACKELMEMCLQFMVARYPHYFSLDLQYKDDGRSGETTHAVFNNGILGTEVDLKTTDPMVVLLENVPEDFGVMLRNPEDGGYYLRAGLICSALGWNVDTKIGKRLNEVHEPVPDYAEKMRFSMDRFFAKFPTSKPIQRGSWGFEIDEPLFMPPGDPHEAYRSYQLDPAQLPITRCNLRVDWQTLRRLPLSGAIIFNFKGLFTPITEFADEPYVPKLALKVLREGKGSIMEYKGTWHVQHVVGPWLEEAARRQEELGTVEVGWEEKTLEESPWFPGWEIKWRSQQGF
ncbi:MAG: hypothetical protein M1831_002159 [Alyxoria varia]|nr:MAG: hypothetical protein M1831_002159 [Alyxoria varia]